MSVSDDPRLVGNDVNAYCPVCDGRSNFVRTSSGTFSLKSDLLSDYFTEDPTGSVGFLILKCVTCSLGALATVYDNPPMQVRLIDFYPKVEKLTQLPNDTPKDIVSEFRSAENCANIEEHRPAATMLRSTIEKTLKKHGYNDFHLSRNLKQLEKDKLITAPLARKSSEVVKILGDEVLHQKWRKIDKKEYLKAHKYTVKLIEAFFDDVEGVSIEMDRIKEKKKLKLVEKQN